MSHPSLPEDFYPPVSRQDWGGRATRAEVNLEAIQANVRGLAEHVSGREVMAVVKADGYGHGASWIARAALQAGATRLGVYTVDEGMALRRAGITAPVLVFGPFEDSEVGTLATHDLTATVTSVRAAESLARAYGGRTVRVHLKVDSGLTRAGATVNEIIPLADRVRAIGSIELEGIYTHFARADEPDEATTAVQITTFRAALQRLQDAGHTFGVVHLANSAGTLWWADGWKDMVRVGIAMYGYSPNPAIPSPVALRPALTLISTVARITSIEPGTGVGYGHAFRAARRSRIALVPIGYGDGLHRALGDGAGSVLIREKRAPIVGRVSMDQITVDVTEVPGVTVGDAVTIIGRQGAAVQTADDLARVLDTISYEVLTSLQGRVPRLYTIRGEVVGARTLGKDEPLAATDGPARE